MNSMFITGTLMVALILLLKAMDKPWYKQGSSGGPVDAYSSSHFLHGIIFGMLGLSYAVSMLVETLWEILENSPMVIDKYRVSGHPTYRGDSVINSLMDLGFCALGWTFFFYVPFWLSLLTIIWVEVIMYMCIGDNLLLNILAILRPRK